MKIKVYNTNNETVGEMELDDKIFGVKWNPDLVHQVLIAKAANKRRPWAHTKQRGEVRGGGIKPWRQKGTGRARHGSRRSPLWVGGGVVFGPRKEKDYSKRINKKMIRIALHSVLSRKLNEGEVKIIDNLKLSDAKTKEFYNMLRGLRSLNSLVVPSKDNKLIYRACSNIPKTKCLAADSLNLIDALKYKNILIDKDAVNNIK